GGGGPRQVMARRHASDEPAQIDLGLDAHGFTDVLAGAAYGVLAEGDANQVSKDKWPLLGADVFDLALQRPGILGQDAGALFGGEQAQVKGAPLPPDFPVPAQENQTAPPD